MRSSDLKRRAIELSAKVAADSITPIEVGVLMNDMVVYTEEVERNGSALGIRKTYLTVQAMEADKNPSDASGNPLRAGMLVSIYNPDVVSDDNGKIYAYKNPGWQLMMKEDLTKGGTVKSDPSKDLTDYQDVF